MREGQTLLLFLFCLFGCTQTDAQLPANLQQGLKITYDVNLFDRISGKKNEIMGEPIKWTYELFISDQKLRINHMTALGYGQHHIIDKADSSHLTIYYDPNGNGSSFSKLDSDTLTTPPGNWTPTISKQDQYKTILGHRCRLIKVQYPYDIEALLWVAEDLPIPSIVFHQSPLQFGLDGIALEYEWIESTGSKKFTATSIKSIEQESDVFDFQIPDSCPLIVPFYDLTGFMPESSAPPKEITHPSYSGGYAELKKYLSKKTSLDYLSSSNTIGTVSFNVEKDGSITDVEFSIWQENPELKSDLEKAFQVMLKWFPATINGQPVRAQCSLYL